MGSQMSLPRQAPQRSVKPSFREIFEAEFSYVWNVLRRLGIATRDLEDLAQHVFFQVHAHLESYEVSRPLRPWLFSFAYNAASNYRALARHRVELSVVAPERVDPAQPADEQLITRQELQLAELALTHVAIDRRAMLLLHEVEGYSMPEIAESLGIPLNTAYSRLRLARREYESVVRRLRAQRGES